MAGRVGPRRFEDGEARPFAGVVAGAGEERGEAVARLGQLLGSAAERVRAHQGGGGLAERTGAHFLAELGDPPLIVGDDVDGDPAAADRRLLHHARLRRLEPALVGDRGSEPQDIAIVEGAGHFPPI